MNSPELLLLVENCPKGAETLVTRCLHILTDKGKTHHFSSVQEDVGQPPQKM